MSATMVMQEGDVQLQQTDMRIALNMTKMAKGGFFQAVIQETQYQIKKPHPKL
jgi:hypothetical protein